MSGQAAEIKREIINGVNVAAIKGLIDAVKEKPELATSKFRIHNKWHGGGHNRSRVDEFHSGGQEHSRSKVFVLDADEPPVLAGEDLGANPVEHLLNALAACMTTTLVYHAAVRGIQLEEVESELEGDIDLQGFLGLTDEVRSGYQDIRVNFKVKTDAKNVERLKALSKLSPVFDVVTNGTRVNVQIEKK